MVQREMPTIMEDEVGVGIIKVGQVAVVCFKSACITGSQEVASASEEIRRFAEEYHPEKIVFDFSNVKFFSSQVLGLLLEIRQVVKMYEGEVVVSGINPRLYRVFKVTSLDRIFRSFPDKQSAIESASTN